MFPGLVSRRGGGGGRCGDIGVTMYRFSGIVLGRFICRKRGDHRKEKFFTSNSVEALIPFNKKHGDEWGWVGMSGGGWR